ncbi:MAG: carboxypeptidase-like regulatory domain-containing protein [Planctomycetota bacterium]
MGRWICGIVAIGIVIAGLFIVLRPREGEEPPLQPAVLQVTGPPTQGDLSPAPPPVAAQAEATSPTQELAPEQKLEPAREEVVAPRVVATLGRGRVKGDSGEPLAGVRVFIVPAPDDLRQAYLDGEPEEWFATGLELTSDEGGSFPLDVARMDVAHAVIARLPGWGWDFAVLDPAAPTLAPIELRLQPTSQLSGRVVNKEGEPLSGVRVIRQWSYVWDSLKTWPTVEALYAELTREVVFTDQEGRFAFQEVRAENQDVHAVKEGLAPGWFWDIPVGYVLKFTLVPGAVIYGKVLDEADHPVPGAKVRTMTYGCLPEQSTPWIDCKPDGSYSIDEALSGSMSVSAWTDQGFASERINVWAPPGEHTKVDFVLRKEATIEGRVVDSRNEGVAGVHLIFESERTGFTNADLESGEDGLFRAAWLPPGETYRICIRGTKEYGPRVMVGIPADSRDVIVRVFEVGAIWGQLTFDGEPAPQVRIRFLPREELPNDHSLDYLFLRRTIQESTKERWVDIENEHYSYRFWPGNYDIEFRAGDYTPLIARNIAVVPGRSPRPLDLQFTHEQALFGSVLDGTTDQPIAGAQVEVLEEYYTGGMQRSPAPFAATSDASGSFFLPTVPRGDPVLLVTAGGYAPRTVRHSMTGLSLAEPLVVKLFRGGRIVGKVETGYSDPSSTVQVVVRELGREDGQATYVTQKGEFAFDHVPVGRVEVVLTDWYYKAAYRLLGPQMRQAEVHDGETVRVDFNAATGVTLRGRVVGWAKPLLMEARLMAGEGEPPIAGAAYTDREGRFRIPYLRPGRYLVYSALGQPGYSIAVSGEVEIRDQDPDELVLEVPGNTVAGIVSRESGEPIPRAVVTVERDRHLTGLLAMCLTDGEGRFAIGGLESGFYTFRARARGCATELLESFQVPGEALDLKLRPAAHLQVSVQDDTGAPLPGALVVVRHTTKPKLAWSDVTGQEGTVQFGTLQAAVHEVAARLQGFVPTDPLLVPLSEGQTRSERLVLVRAGELQVFVRDVKGKLAEGVSVALLNEEGDSLAARMTDEKGSVLFEELAPGWYQAATGEALEVKDAAEVMPGERAELELIVKAE